MTADDAEREQRLRRLGPGGGDAEGLRRQPRARDPRWERKGAFLGPKSTGRVISAPTGVSATGWPSEAHIS